MTITTSTAVCLGLSVLVMTGAPAMADQEAPETSVAPAAMDTTADTLTTQSSSPPAQNPRIWWGPEGNPLPFKTDEEIMAFMRDAKVVSKKTLKTGVTWPWKVLDAGRLYLRMRRVYDGEDAGIG